MKKGMSQEDFSKELEKLRAFGDMFITTLKEESVILGREEIHNYHDKGYKYLLSIKKNFLEFIRTFMEINLDEEIIEENITLLDKEFITIDFDKRESDLIYEVKLKDKKVYFILLEIQSSVDRKMAYRLLNYMVEIWRKCESNRKKNKTFSLPKIIPCVLYTGKNKWTSPIEFKNLYEDIEGNEEYLLNFKYILIDVHRYNSNDLLKMGSILSSAFYMEKSERKTIEKRFNTLLGSLKYADKEEIEIFMRWLTSVFVIDEEKRERIDEKFIRRDEPMSNLTRIARSIYNDGEERGRITSIKKLLSYKLKISLDSECMELINNISLPKLEEIERKIFEITSWKEVEELIRG